MAAPDIFVPSGSANGLPVAIGTSSTPLATTPSTASTLYEVYLWISSTDALNPVTVTVSIGGVVWAIIKVAAGGGPYCAIPGLRLGPSIAVTALATAAGDAAAIINVNQVK